MSDDPTSHSGDETVSVIDASKVLGVSKQRIFKALKRLGIETLKQRHPAHGNQRIAYITQADFERVKENLVAKPIEADAPAWAEPPSVVGVFYLIQLEPVHDPNRFKVGFTSSLQERLRDLRCSAPYLTLVETWPCKPLWEKTAIDCVTAGCERLHTEVFGCESIDAVKASCQAFFALMPDSGTDVDNG